MADKDLLKSGILVLISQIVDVSILESSQVAWGLLKWPACTMTTLVWEHPATECVATTSCAVCATAHPTVKHKCSSCEGGVKCIHPLNEARQLPTSFSPSGQQFYMSHKGYDAGPHSSHCGRPHDVVHQPCCNDEARFRDLTGMLFFCCCVWGWIFLFSVHVSLLLSLFNLFCTDSALLQLGIYHTCELGGGGGWWSFDPKSYHESYSYSCSYWL